MLLRLQIEEKVNQGALEACSFSSEADVAAATKLRGAIEIEEAEALANVDVTLPFFIKWCSPSAHGFVVVSRVAIRNGRMRHVGKAQQRLALFYF